MSRPKQDATEDLKDLLRRLKTIQLIEEHKMTVDAAGAHKTIPIQSEAEFKLSDD